jgi:hypothetical protein
LDEVDVVLLPIITTLGTGCGDVWCFLFARLPPADLKWKRFMAEVAVENKSWSPLLGGVPEEEREDELDIGPDLWSTVILLLLCELFPNPCKEKNKK